MLDNTINILRLAGHGYCCVQIPLLLIMEAHGRQDPLLIRTLSPLCHGFPDTIGPCGALTGGACLLGYFAGKGSAHTDADDRLPLMLDQLTRWFRAHCKDLHGGINCADIVPAGLPEPEICGSLISQVYEQVLELLIANGFNPAEPPVDV